jgi:hypothetical protein
LTPEAARYLAKAHQALGEAIQIAAIQLAPVAARCAYYTAFHSAEALIFERTAAWPKPTPGFAASSPVSSETNPGSPLTQEHSWHEPTNSRKSVTTASIRTKGSRWNKPDGRYNRPLNLSETCKASWTDNRAPTQTPFSIPTPATFVSLIVPHLLGRRRRDGCKRIPRDFDAAAYPTPLNIPIPATMARRLSSANRSVSSCSRVRPCHNSPHASSGRKATRRS